MYNTMVLIQKILNNSDFRHIAVKFICPDSMGREALKYFIETR